MNLTNLRLSSPMGINITKRTVTCRQIDACKSTNSVVRLLPSSRSKYRPARGNLHSRSTINKFLESQHSLEYVYFPSLCWYLKVGFQSRHSNQMWPSVLFTLEAEIFTFMSSPTSGVGSLTFKGHSSFWNALDYIHTLSFHDAKRQCSMYPHTKFFIYFRWAFIFSVSGFPSSPIYHVRIKSKTF